MSSHRCEVCHGIFIDGELFRQVKAQARLHAHHSASQNPRIENPQQRHCPRQCASMTIITVNGITIDICPHCDGIWLDSGELEKMILQYGHPQKHELTKLGVSLATMGATTFPHSKAKQSNHDVLNVLDLASTVLDLFNVFN
jgi:Zn-finger nucleic acid-binding protein